jgi:hypothetical protein
MCFGKPHAVFTLHTTGHSGQDVYVSVFGTLEKAIEHAGRMGWIERKWIMRSVPDLLDTEEQVWEMIGPGVK